METSVLRTRTRNPSSAAQLADRQAREFHHEDATGPRLNRALAAGFVEWFRVRFDNHSAYAFEELLEAGLENLFTLLIVVDGDREVDECATVVGRTLVDTLGVWTPDTLDFADTVRKLWSPEGDEDLEARTREFEENWGDYLASLRTVTGDCRTCARPNCRKCRDEVQKTCGDHAARRREFGDFPPREEPRWPAG